MGISALGEMRTNAGLGWKVTRLPSHDHGGREELPQGSWSWAGVARRSVVAVCVRGGRRARNAGEKGEAGIGRHYSRPMDSPASLFGMKPVSEHW